MPYGQCHTTLTDPAEKWGPCHSPRNGPDCHRDRNRARLDLRSRPEAPGGNSQEPARTRPPPAHRSPPALTSVAEAHGRSVAQVVLRRLIQREAVVIPKSVRPNRMAENLDVFGFTLSEEEMAGIAALDAGTSQFFGHRDPAMVSRLGRVRVED
ncbi:aldo/keto reductase [Streptomyces sp. CA-179760]|uniref:aldo/keto reductase n=1 Tax=Streptomyces sp. CA-179760 TaxID=3240054 RepID=UPI003D8DFDEC